MFEKKQRHALKKKYKRFRMGVTDIFNHLFYLLKPGSIVNKCDIRFVGLQRSGNHAILNWLFSPLNEVKCFLNYVPVNKNPFIYFKKKGTTTEFPQEFFKKFNVKFEQLGFFSRKNALIYSYEDEFLEDVFLEKFERNHDRWVGRSEKRYSILLLRDPFNLFASRLKREETHENTYALRDEHERQILIRIWKQHAREFLNETNYINNKKVVVNYNRWVQETDYRRQLAEELELDGFSDTGTEAVLPVGGGSSFDKTNVAASEMKVFERWQYYRDDPVFSTIFEDKEIIELSNRIFGEIPGVREWLDSKNTETS